MTQAWSLVGGRGGKTDNSGPKWDPEKEMGSDMVEAVRSTRLVLTLGVSTHLGTEEIRDGWLGPQDPEGGRDCKPRRNSDCNRLE